MKRVVYLSHFLSGETPLYGGEKSIQVINKTSIKHGDTANTLNLVLPNHAGTHVDVPYHFFTEGKKLSDFDASFWVFYYPQIVDVPSGDGYLVTYDDIAENISEKTDLLLIRTGYERYRNKPRYWQKIPGLAPDLAIGLRSNYKDLRAVGVDTISITSRLHRATGRDAHRAFLESNHNGCPIIIIEDMKLSNYSCMFKQVIVLPLLIKDSDGAPCTILAKQTR